MGLREPMRFPSVREPGERGLSALLMPTDAAMVGLWGRELPLDMGRPSVVREIVRCIIVRRVLLSRQQSRRSKEHLLD